MLRQQIVNLVEWLSLAVEMIDVVIISFGVLTATYGFVCSLISRQPLGFNQIRLKLSRYLSLSLEFLLGSDILLTAIGPSWDQIGKLGAIAAIRTGLNFFLIHETSLD